MADRTNIAVFRHPHVNFGDFVGIVDIRGKAERFAVIHTAIGLD